MNSQIKSGLLLNYINLGLSSLIPLLYTPVMLSLLGQSEYGLYKLSGSVTSYLSLIALGLGSAITRYLIKARVEEGQAAEERMLGLFVAIFGVVALITVVAGGILAFNLDAFYAASLSAAELHRMKILVFLLACNTSVSFLTAPYLSAINAHERFIFLQSFAILTTCVGPLVNLMALYLGYASIGLAVTSLVMTILYRMIYSCYVRRKMQIRVRFSRSSFKIMPEILSFSFWIFVSNIVGQLYGATDMVLIGHIPELATVGVAVYSVGETLNSMIITLNAGFSAMFVPKANRMVFSAASDTELTETAIRLGRIQSLIISLFVSGFIAFGHPFVHFYLGDAYLEAYWIAVICLIPGCIPLTQSFCLNILIARNKNRFRASVYLLVAIANAVGTWVLLPSYGLMGAAVMTSLASLTGCSFIMNWYYYKKMHIDIPLFWQEVAKIWVVPACLCIGVILCSRMTDFYSIGNFLWGTVTFAIAYMALSWRYVMNSSEKAIIRQLVK